jgi:hypothetical protein
MSKLSRLESRAPEVWENWTRSSGRWCPRRASILFRSLSESSSTNQKFRLVQFVRACACKRFVLGSVRRFRYRLEVPVSWTESFGGPELTDKINGLISSDRKFRWLPLELSVAHLSPSI